MACIWNVTVEIRDVLGAKKGLKRLTGTKCPFDMGSPVSC